MMSNVLGEGFFGFLFREVFARLLPLRGFSGVIMLGHLTGEKMTDARSVFGFLDGSLFRISCVRSPFLYEHSTRPHLRIRQDWS